jgi:hypothetical protein
MCLNLAALYAAVFSLRALRPRQLVCVQSLLSMSSQERCQCGLLTLPLSDSPAHAPTYVYDDRDRSFSSDHALQQHLNSPVHKQSSPLDNFFLSFSYFDYNPFAGPLDKFAAHRAKPRICACGLSN